MAPEKMALIALRVVMTNLASGVPTFKTALLIAHYIHIEKQFENWYADAKKDHEEHKFWLRYPNPGRRAVEEWLKAVRKKKGVGYAPQWQWDEGTKVTLGSTLIELLLIAHPDVFECISNVQLPGDADNKKSRPNVVKLLVMREEMLQWFLKQEASVELLRALTEPLIFPPEDWSADRVARQRVDAEGE
jgi:hypothetical protein